MWLGVLDFTSLTSNYHPIKKVVTLLHYPAKLPHFKCSIPLTPRSHFNEIIIHVLPSCKIFTFTWFVVLLIMTKKVPFSGKQRRYLHMEIMPFIRIRIIIIYSGTIESKKIYSLPNFNEIIV